MPKQKKSGDIRGGDLSPEEEALIGKVSKIVLALDKTTKSQKFYLPNNPVLINHQNDLFDQFKDYFSSEKEMTLKVSAAAFLFMNNIVYQNPVKTENFAFKLHNDGIRSITFYDGLTKEELLEFMSILNKGMELQADATEEDLVTLLWEKQFDNIKYQVVESIIESALIEDGKSTEDRVEDIIQENKSNFYGLGEEYKDIIEIDEIPLAYDATNFGEMFKTKMVLAKEDLDKMHHEIEYSEKKENVLIDFMDILPQVLEEEITEDDFKKVLAIIQGIVDSCIFNGDLNTASRVLEKLNRFPVIIGGGKVPIQKDIEDFLNNISKKEKIDELINCLNLSFTGALEEIVEYISRLNEGSIPNLLKSLPKIPDNHYRKSICSGIAVIFKGDPTTFLNYINTKDSESVHDLVFLLSQIKNERVVDLIPHVISHSDKSIKKESISLLKNFKNNSKAIKILLNTLEDNDIELRTLTLRILATTENREVAKHLLSKISNEEFSEKDLMEKKSYFFTISKISQNDFIPYLSDILETKRWVSKEKIDELYQCACFALGIIGTDKAKELLEKGTNSKNKSIQKYCQSMLRKIEMGA